MAEITVKELNAPVIADVGACIAAAEDEYHGKIAALADYLVGSGRIRIVMLAGPSGSGKTTTANLLADGIRARGEECLVVSLDDFYRDAVDPEYPRAEDGERNYECPEALHLCEVGATLLAISEGQSFSLPKYDFKEGRRVSLTEHPPMPEGCVIIEGLHALNPAICDPLPRDRVLKLFVSLSTNINEDGVRILSGRKLRFVRRMVRDSIYRGADAQRTLKMWEGVLKAEDIYLYPYKESADVAFDTFHRFEPGVMRSFAEALITEELESSSEYARTVITALRRAEHISAELIPENSLIREFIPGGIYEALY